MVHTKRFYGFLLAIMLSAVFVLGSPVQAEDSTLTDAKLVQIRSRCHEIKASLTRIHANDALLRVNRGQLYERLSTKLAAPLNSRIALNRLDGSSLLSVTSSYELNLTEFRSRYQAYEEQLTTTMRTDCVKQPASFYDNLQLAREKRRAVYESTQKLARNITDYKQAFTEFAKPYREDQ